ncbi:MAG: hypothetical protein EOO52_09165 [Gammaproteobacteria bacterium]|nr:MAG: hypothetical protein EOO52_09165 [Gammaproteobacteria bacterium]
MNLPAAFIFFFVIVPGAALLIAIIAIIRRNQTEKKLFRTGVVYLKKLRIFLMYIQQHRGLTNGFFHGNSLLAGDIEKLEQKIGLAIVDIQSIDGWMQQNGNWESLIDHWQRIKAYFRNANAEINLKQHNNLIANLLYLIDDLAYAHHLGRLGIVDAADANWRKLLFIAEYVGQARALGMGVASKGTCTSVVRIQLNHLVAKIKSNLDPKWPNETLNDFRNFLTIIQQQIITESPSIAAEDYFKIATRCIDHLLSEFDRQVDRIQFHSTSIT